MTMAASLHELRSAVRRELPEEAFSRRPWVGVALLSLVPVVAVVTALVARPDLPWYVAVLGSVVLGNVYVTLFSGAHEGLHGTIFRRRWAQDLLGFAGCAIFCVSPTLWRIWHNRMHHHHTNVSGTDPDIAGTIERFRQMPWARFLYRLILGSRHPLSLFYFPTRLTLHHQVVLWLVSPRNPEAYHGLDRRRAIAESLAAAGFWLALAVVLGPRGAIFGIALPMAFANAGMISYITTQHQLRPLTAENDPLANTMGVRTARWIDVMHLNLSHHIEHHLFPEMNGRSLPLVRAVLERHAGPRYLAPPHWRALLWVARTPRLYLDAETLVDLDERQRVKLSEVEQALRHGPRR
jgi:fatty acid desaturase